ncbi:hypothetical protein BKA70DRAFT_1257335 [Coprinopsis sp. MPI-PUGE-AT-0042]|nr:hypothetical protein BKA70DRAFT_1257335 [Coprinopsis sp. MPI-PUGE-AT-0042]
MTVTFGNRRLAFYVFVFLLSGTVLGVAAYLASVLDVSAFIVFAIIVSALQIFIFLLTLQWSKPKYEQGLLVIFGILWLAMGAYTTDVIGHIQCDAIPSSAMIPGKNDGEVSQKSWCQQMKVVQAFSWALFASFVIAFIVLMQLIEQAKKFGRYNIANEPIKELPWFDEMPGYYNQGTTGMMPMGGPGPMPYPQGGYPYGGYPQAQPGHAIMIQPGVNGAPPVVSQVPMSAGLPMSAI